ncbi:MAG: polyphenol oxidase family protein [Candidatus Adiutrix sp.]|nr:polyphenol oxidase family protein [Candidatus Adiutrix sp.]
MQQHTEQNLRWYSFSLFEPHPELRHGVFTRFGGVSGPQGDELSLAFNAAEPTERTLINIRRAAEALRLPSPALSRQNHGDWVLVVRPGDNYRPQGPEEVRGDYDALVAPEPGVSLMIKVADCQAVILYHPQSRALGLAHSGWRGSVRNILGKTVAEMAALGADPAEIKAAISPSLGPCCAEFINYRQELPEKFWEFMNDNHFDFWAISRRQLTEAGLRAENIAVAGVCTKCSPEFYSYRRGDAARFGIMAGVAA